MEERIIIATDGKIDLTIPKDYEEYDNNFDIYLHGTDELIGNIWFDEGLDLEFNKYYGNVGYNIKEKYRGNRYAYKSLLLMKKVMLDNEINEMIFSIKPNNEASIKTVKRLGARLICTRPLPKNHKLYNLTGDKILIYKYDIEEKNSKLGGK